MLLSFAVLFTAGLFFFSSCDNVAIDENSKVTPLDVEMSEDDAMAEDVLNTMDAMVDDELAAMDDANYDPAFLKSTADDGYVCKTVTVDKPDTLSFPKTITIDYGEGCSVVINGDTITRSGSIVITITDRWFVEGAVRTVTFIDFFINDIQIEGSITVTNLGVNEDGQMVFEIVVDDGTITYSDTLVYTRNSHKFRYWVRAANPLLDTLFITGECSGVNGDGLEYHHRINNRLVMIRCENYRYQWTLVGGEIDMERNGNTAQINFGNGTCDREAVMTVNGQSREIEMRQRFNQRRRVFSRISNN